LSGSKSSDSFTNNQYPQQQYQQQQYQQQGGQRSNNKSLDAFVAKKSSIPIIVTVVEGEEILRTMLVWGVLRHVEELLGIIMPILLILIVMVNNTMEEEEEGVH